MSILSAVKDFIATYPNLASGAVVTSDYSGSEPTWYSINPLSGNPVIEEDIAGNKRKQFPFAFRSMEYTADELERLDNISFFETFAEWLETQSRVGNLPTLASGKTPDSIEAIDWAYLYEYGNSDTGIYQINCRLIYYQDAP